MVDRRKTKAVKKVKGEERRTRTVDRRRKLRRKADQEVYQMSERALRMAAENRRDMRKMLAAITQVITVQGEDRKELRGHITTCEKSSLETQQAALKTQEDVARLSEDVQTVLAVNHQQTEQLKAMDTIAPWVQGKIESEIQLVRIRKGLIRFGMGMLKENVQRASGQILLIGIGLYITGHAAVSAGANEFLPRWLELLLK